MSMAVPVRAWGWHGLTPTILSIESKSSKWQASRAHGVDRCHRDAQSQPRMVNQTVPPTPVLICDYRHPSRLKSSRSDFETKSRPSQQYEICAMKPFDSESSRSEVSTCDLALPLQDNSNGRQNLFIFKGRFVQSQCWNLQGKSRQSFTIAHNPLLRMQEGD